MGNGKIHRSSAYWEMGLEALDFKNYIAVNYTLIRKYGLHAAVLIGELASEARYYKREGRLNDGWFFSTVENIEEHTGLNAYYQRETLKTLQDTGIVEIKYSGLPRKRYFRVDAMRIIEEMSTDKELAQQQCFTQLTTSDESSEPLATYPVNDNNCNEQPEQTTVRKKEDIPFAEIIDYLNEKAGTRYRASTPKTKANIRARWNEGYRLDDFIRVIDVKVADWLGDEKMARYLCPDTLFGTKFEKYLNQPIKATQQPTGRLSDYNFAGKQETITVTDDAYDWSGYDDIRF